jgi:hypothetical protein
MPFRFVWATLAAVQEGLGGQTRAIVMAVMAGITALAAVLVLVPYPLKMDSTGRLVPQVRRIVYAPTAGYIKEFAVKPGDAVGPQATLGTAFDTDLYEKLRTKPIGRTSSSRKIERRFPATRSNRYLPASSSRTTPTPTPTTTANSRYYRLRSPTTRSDWSSARSGRCSTVRSEKS